MRTSGQRSKIAAAAGRRAGPAKRRRGFWRIALLLLPMPLLAALAACGSGSSAGTVTVTSVAVTPASASVQINTQATFVAQVNLSNNSSSTSTNTNVTWEVNGVSGGNGSVGTIVATAADNHVATYNAPSSVPSTNNGQVNITAVAPQEPNNASDTATVTSNTVVVTITVATGVTVTPSACTAPAGGTTCQFTALQNNVRDGNATWTVSNTNCTGCAGSIDSTGLFTAPPFPPPGGTVTITATDGANTATATAQIVYSDKSLSGPFAFSYAGNDGSGFSAAAGSLVSDGQGRILSGVEDASSLGAGVSAGVPVSGTYSVGEDGRGQVCLNPNAQQCGVTLRFVMTTNEHAAIISFGANTTGSGSMDGQTLNDLSGSATAIAGPYVFSALGADAAFKPLGIAGRFSANGGGGIPSGGGILDVNDAGAVTPADSSLSGSYLFDNSFPNSGRGTITLSSATTGQRQFAFYIVDSTHLRFIETDSLAFLSGDIYSEPAGAFSTATLAAGKYAFTAGGQASANSYAAAYAAGGVFASDGNGNATGGLLDTNKGGGSANVKLAVSLGSCAYITDATTGRTDLKLYAGSGTCPSGAAVSEFAAYPSAQGPWLLLELDSGAVATGVAYPQQTQTPSFSGSFAMNLAGQGVFHNAAASYQPDAVGQLAISSGSISSGNLDVKLFSDPGFTSTISAASGAFTSADSTYGRGTVAITGTTPSVSYTLSFYLINANTALFFDQDKNSTWVETGLLTNQF